MPLLIDTLIAQIPNVKSQAQSRHDNANIVTLTNKFYEECQARQDELVDKVKSTKISYFKKLAVRRYNDSNARFVLKFLKELGVKGFSVEQTMLFILACAANENEVLAGWDYMQQQLSNNYIHAAQNASNFVKLLLEHGKSLAPAICMCYLEKIAELIESRESASPVPLECQKAVLRKYCQYHATTRFNSTNEFDTYWHCAIGVLIKERGAEKMQTLQQLYQSLVGAAPDIRAQRTEKDIYKALRVNMASMGNYIQPSYSLDELAIKGNLTSIEVAANRVLDSSKLNLEHDQALVAMLKDPQASDPYIYEFTDLECAEQASLYFYCAHMQPQVTWHLLQRVAPMVVDNLINPVEPRVEKPQAANLNQFELFKRSVGNITACKAFTAGLGILALAAYACPKPNM